MCESADRNALKGLLALCPVTLRRRQPKRGAWVTVARTCRGRRRSGRRDGHRTPKRWGAARHSPATGHPAAKGGEPGTGASASSAGGFSVITPTRRQALSNAPQCPSFTLQLLQQRMKTARGETISSGRSRSGNPHLSSRRKVYISRNDQAISPGHARWILAAPGLGIAPSEIKQLIGIGRHRLPSCPCYSGS